MKREDYLKLSELCKFTYKTGETEKQLFIDDFVKIWQLIGIDCGLKEPVQLHSVIFDKSDKTLMSNFRTETIYTSLKGNKHVDRLGINVIRWIPKREGECERLDIYS